MVEQAEQEQTDRAKLAARIAGLRVARDMSQQELAQRARLSIATIQGWEQGKSSPGALALRDLARALKTTADMILDFDDVEPVKRGKGRPKQVEQESPRRGRDRLSLAAFRKEMKKCIAELKDLGQCDMHLLPPIEVRKVALQIERAMSQLTTDATG